MSAPRRFRIRYDTWTGRLLGVLGFGHRWSGIVVDHRTLTASMGVGFRCTVPLEDITGAVQVPGRRVLSRGVHGWRGRWLVNGSGQGIVRVTIDPHARAYVLGVPVRLRELAVSVEDPDGLIHACRPETSPIGA